MGRTAAVAATAVLLAAPLLVTGPASASSTVRIPKLEREIKAGFKAPPSKLRVTVKCPAQVTWVKGKIFYCKAVATDGTKYRVRVKLRSEASGVLSWKAVV